MKTISLLTPLFVSSFMVLDNANAFSASSKSSNFENSNFGRVILGISLPGTGSKWPFPKGSVWLNFSTSLGISDKSSYGTRSSFLPISAAAEYSLEPHWAIGPYLGYQSITYSDSYLGETYSSKLRNLTLGARITFHGSDVINKYLGAGLDIKKWDIYSTFSAGLLSQTWNIETRFESARNYEATWSPTFGFVLGAKYFVYQTLAIHGEFGKGNFGFLNFGISYWLK